jgi:hypothetical protein
VTSATPAAPRQRRGSLTTLLRPSLSLPLAAATTTAAALGLVVMHLTVGAAVIPAMARTARAG